MTNGNSISQKLNAAYSQALRFTTSHYENFPVVSFFIPRIIRKHIAVVYQFARQADDLADEGNEDSKLRIQKLESYQKIFQNCLNGIYENDFWFALHNTISEFQLNPQLFLDLISAFKQDITKNRYNSFTELLDYCNRSANPVGRIILGIYGINNIEAFQYSDSICTALQLTNFYQDISVDFIKGRIYIPLDEMKMFEVDEKVFELKKNNTNFILLLKHQVDRTEKLFTEGERLLTFLPRNLRIQIKMTILGGDTILKKIKNMNYNALEFRPRLDKIDILKILLKAVFQK